MKLIVQIPALNEAESLAIAIRFAECAHVS